MIQEHPYLDKTDNVSKQSWELDCALCGRMCYCIIPVVSRTPTLGASLF